MVHVRRSLSVRTGLLGAMLAAPVAFTACLTPEFDLSNALGGGGSEGGDGDGPDTSQGGEASCDPCEVDQKCSAAADCVEPSTGEGFVQCLEGTCQMACPSGFADCNRRAEDGCEIDLSNDPEHCSACGEACSPAHASGVCIDATCRVGPDGCDEGWADCDGDANATDGTVTGCEVNTADDSDHCGACGLKCGGSGDGVESASCSNSLCEVRCSNALCPDGSPERSCSEELGAPEHCGSCGSACSESAPYCVEDSCSATPAIRAVSNAQGSVNWLNGAPNIMTSLSLEGATPGNRMILLAIRYYSSWGSQVGPIISYGGRDFSQVGGVTDGGFIGFYALGECEIAQATNDQLFVGFTGSGGLHLAMHATLFENVDQDVTLATIDQSCAPCSGSPYASLRLEPGAFAEQNWFYSAVLTAGGDEVSNVSQLAPFATGGPGVRTLVQDPEKPESTLLSTFLYGADEVASDFLFDLGSGHQNGATAVGLEIPAGGIPPLCP